MLEDLARKLAASPGLDGARQAILQALGHVARLSSVPSLRPVMMKFTGPVQT